MKKRKNYVTFVTAESTKVKFGFFSVFVFASNVTIPKHRTNLNATFIEQDINWFHEVNKLYDGTLNEVHHFL